MATFDQFTKVLALYEDGPDNTKKLFNLGFNASGDCDCFVQSASGDPTSSTEGTINFGGDVSVMCAYNGASTKSSILVGDSFNLAKTERTAEVTRAMNKEDTIVADLATEQSARISGDGTLQTNIDAEEARAMTSEGTLTNNLANEVYNRTSADTAHDNALASEIITARSAETVNMNRVIAEENRAQAAEAANEALVATEESRALTAENLNTVAHDAYVLSNDAVLALDRLNRAADIAASEVSTAATQSNLRLAQKNAIETLITIEEAARIAGDAALNVRINNLIDNTDEEALNSLQEIITAYQAEDSSLSAIAATNLATFTNWVDDLNFATGPTFTSQANDIRSRLDDLEAFAAALQAS